jgi:CxxC motif-containing protein
MHSLTCIVCPTGCALRVDETPEGLRVGGGRCPRGAAYAQEELRAPKRMVTAACPIINPPENGPRRAPVKTTRPCPRERIPELLADIRRTSLSLPIRAGQTVIADWQGSGIDVAAVRDIG